MERFESRLEQIEELSADVRRLRWERVDGQALTFLPGQYVTVYQTDGAGRTLAGAYSLCDPPRSDGSYAFCVKRTGSSGCADALLQRNIGDAVLTEGPAGRFVLEDPPNSDVVLVATGVGITPFHAMLQQLERIATQRHVWLLLGARQREELLFDHDWRTLAAARANFHYWPTVSRSNLGDGWGGAVGHVTALIDHIPQIATLRCQIYLCGRKDMIDEARSLLSHLGQPETAIFIDA